MTDGNNITNNSENEEKKDNTISFFGEIDKHPNGRLKSQYPAWYFDNQVEDLTETIRFKESQVDRGLVDRTEMGDFRAKLKRDKERLEQIIDSKPRLPGPQKNRIYSASKTLGEKISDSMPSHTQMQKGLVSANDEADRMSLPCIKLDDKEGELLHTMGIPMTNDGRVSRDSAIRGWQILRKSIGETTNAEILRREDVSGRNFK